MLHTCHARNVYEIVLEKHSMSLHTPDEAPENDSCYECIRIRQAAATNYQIHITFLKIGKNDLH